jgi:hypothetical protein
MRAMAETTTTTMMNLTNLHAGFNSHRSITIRTNTKERLYKIMGIKKQQS